MRMRVSAVGALLAVVLSVPAAAAQAGADAAASYLYPLKVDDPEGDHLGLGGSGTIPVPGDANPENDLLAFEATDDAATTVLRIQVATFEFGAPGTGPATISLALTGPAAEDWEITVSYQSGGEGVAVADFDPASGDADVLMPGARAEVDVEGGHVYLFADHSASGLATGDVLTFDSLSSGRGVSSPTGQTLTFSGRDNIAVEGLTYTLARGAFPPPPTTAPVVYEDSDAATLEVARSFEEATTELHVINWTTELTSAEVAYEVAATAGSVALSLVDAAEFTILQNTFSGEDANVLVQRNLTAGVWVLALDFRGFVGSLNVTVDEAPPMGTDPSPSGSGSPRPTGTGSTGPGTGNPTGSAPAGGDDDEDSPGLGVVLLLGVLAVAALAARRRL